MNLKEKRNQLLAKAEEILNKAIAETRSMTAEEKTAYDAAMTEAQSLNETIEAEERMAQMKKSAGAPPIKPNPGGEGRTAEKEQEEYRSNFFAFLAGNNPEKRGLTVADNGTLLPTSVYQEVMGLMNKVNGVLSAKVKHIPSFVGTVNVPVGSAATKGHILTAANKSVEAAVGTISNKAMTMYTYTSDILPVDKKLLTGSPAAVQTFVAGLLAEAIGTAANEHMTTGSGTAQPEGVVTAATLGKTAAATAAVTYDELVDLEGSVSFKYRVNAQWMFNDKTLTVLKKLKNSNGDPLWTRGSVALGTPDTFMGYTYIVNDNMDDLGAGKKPILFGDFTQYLVAMSENIAVDTLVEPYKAQGQIGLFILADYAGVLGNAGECLKYLQCAAA